MGLTDRFTVLENVIRCNDTGAEFVFFGLRSNVTQIKSLEGADIVWVEEAESVTEKSWDVLIPTVRKPGSEIWISFNPDDELDDTYQRFVVKPPKGALVVKVTWRDNPWFPVELKQEKDELEKANYKKYLWIWEGECNQSYTDSIIQPEWFEAAIDAHVKLGIKPQGIKSVGFDPADEGEDEKALAYRHGIVLLNLEGWLEGDLDDATEKAYSFCEDNHVDDFVYDSIGIGAGVKVKMKKNVGKKGISITGFCGSETVRHAKHKYMEDKTNEDMFKNLRAQFIWYLRDRFENTYKAVVKGEYIDPEHLISISSTIDKDTLHKFRKETTRIERKRGGLGNAFVQIISKADMDESPNLFDAVVYAFANPDPQPEYEEIDFASAWQ